MSDKKANYSKAVEIFSKLKTLDEKKEAWKHITEVLEESIELERIYLSGQLTDLDNFKEKIKK